MFLSQGNVDESLMHSKGVVDLALFSSGIRILTLKKKESIAAVHRNDGQHGRTQGAKTKKNIPLSVDYFEDDQY